VSADDAARWNARFAATAPTWAVHPIVAELPPAARVLELAAGASGSALALAAAGARVTAVDVSDVALAQLAQEAAARGLADRIAPIVADLDTWSPPPAAFDLVLATRFWAPAVFARAARAVAPGGTLAWETFTLAEQRHRPTFAASFCLQDSEPASRLPADLPFEVVRMLDLDDGAHATRRFLARRRG
jgi:cyclopropane fatty-acyl-phospholipid synthase-like methyltransferase